MPCTSSSAVFSSARSPLETTVGRIGGDELLNLPGDVREGLALVADDLAEEEVLRLDGRRASYSESIFESRMYSLDRVVLQEAGAAKGLERLGERAVGALGADTLTIGSIRSFTLNAMS